jgi:GH25 family lysozyme M1 (1,4-beta-N-acetylmuramidase)
MAESAQGQDRSNWQPVGPWAANLTFGIVKATEGISFADPTFAYNWSNLKVEGKIRGAYHFYHPALSAARQAAFFVQTVSAHGLEAGDLLVSDSEITSGVDGVLRMSPHAAQRSALLDAGPDSSVAYRPAFGHAVMDEAPLVSQSVLSTGNLQFLEEVRRLAPHNPVLIYTNLSVARQLGSCTGFPLWIAYPAADAPSSVAPWRDWTLWQWSFSGGYADCDQDAYNGTAEEMRAWAGSFKPKPSPPPAPRLPSLEDELPQLNAGNGAQTEITFPAGSATGIQFFNDCQAAGDPPPMLRIAVHSAADAFSQIEGKREGEFVLKASGITTVAFTAKDVNGLSISRYAQGSSVPVAYALT